MKKIAFLGDPHAKMSNLIEIEKLILFLVSLKKDGKISHLCILGDLFDTHSLIRLEIRDFWEKQLKTLNTVFSKKEVAIITGNHDQPGSSEREHISALDSLSQDKSIMVSKGYTSWMGLTLVPYTSSEEKFLKTVETAKKESPESLKYLVCHQTFKNAKYDNGMYAPDGFDYDKIPHTNIISGHIHTTMRFNKVFYTGTARWDSAIDADKLKGIHVLDLSDDSWEFYNTNTVVTPMYKIEIREGDEIFPEFEKNAKYSIHLIGSSKWIAKLKPKLKDHKIKTTFTDSKVKRDYSKLNSFEEYVRNAEVSVNKNDIFLLLGRL